MHYPFPDNSSSFWLKNNPGQRYPQLHEDITADVVVIGGGITGLTTAYVLKQAGMSVVVLERQTIANGTTSGTTGKVTTQHGLIYAELLQQLGEEKTQHYADAYSAAMRDIETLIKSENIACRWTKAHNYVYTTDPTKVQQFKDEAEAAAKLGLPATFETDTELPFAVEAAVKFADQANFNVTDYCGELAALVAGNGSFVFENSHAVSVQDGSPGRVSTAHGSVTASHIVVATLVPTWPLMARASYGLFESPETSYIVAGKTASGLQNMYISPDKNHYSILPVQDGTQRYMLIGGEAHIPGLGRAKPRQDKLARYGKQWFDMSDIEYQWGAMDYTAYDKLPLIGKLYPWSRHIYAASGFKKWGLSGSMVAATMIRDLISGASPPAAQLFRTHRLKAVLAIPKTIVSHLKA